MVSKVAIVGGGIAGLSAAFYLSKEFPELKISLLEKSNRLGGALQTTLRDEFLIENSGDMFVTDPGDAIELCRELNFLDQLIETNRENRFSSIVRDGKLVRIPAGFSLMLPNQLRSVLQSRLLSWRGKFRFLAEYFVGHNRNAADESLASFATRRFGTETFERIIQPLVAGIYSARAEELSMQATMKRFLDMEQEHGGMIRAARAKRQTDASREASGARYGMFVAPKHGMQSLVDALVEHLADVNVRYEDPAREIVYEDEHWHINGSGESFDAVVVAGNASVAASVLRLENGIVESLRSISFGSMIVVTMECRLEDFEFAPQGFGCVIPEIENRNLIACSFASNKFVGRAEGGKMLLRCFVGGRNIDQWKDSHDEDLIEMVTVEIKQLLGFSPDAKPRCEVFRWLNCMPQYRVGHLGLVAKIKDQVGEYPGLALAGCSYDGVGIPACIASGKAAARMIGKYLVVK